MTNSNATLPDDTAGRDMARERDIFRRGSTTYYFSSAFFPEPVRSDVFRLYSFVRVADNYVDEQPRQPERLLALEQRWQAAWSDESFRTVTDMTDDTDTRVLKNMVYVVRRYGFDPAWTDAFFNAMRADIAPQPYETIEDILQYIYGSAEVVGLMMARILGLPAEAAEAARMQGRAMQFINFIRDVAEDNGLGRQYVPRTDLHRFNLTDLSAATAKAQPEAFAACIRFEIERYDAWQAEAATGYRYIPKRYRIPIRTAADMYNWTAREIYKDPAVIFKRKVKPKKWMVMGRVLYRTVYG